MCKEAHSLLIVQYLRYRVETADQLRLYISVKYLPTLCLWTGQITSTAKLFSGKI